MSKYIGTPVVNLSVDTVDVTGDITATDSTPELILLNDTHEDTDGGREGKITFKGEQSGGEVTVLAQIKSGHDGTSDDEKGDLIFKTNDGSDGASPTEAMRIESDQQVLITTSADAKGLTIKNSGNNRPYLNMDANRSGAGNNLAQINFKWDGTDVARIIAVAGADTTNKDDAHITFGTASAGSVNEAMRIDSSGNVGIGTTSPDTSLDIESATPIIRLKDTDTGSYGEISASSGDGNMFIKADEGNATAASGIRFHVDGSHVCRVEDTKFFLGKTTAGVDQVGSELRNGVGNYAVLGTSSSYSPFISNRTGSDGHQFVFRNDNTNVGYIKHDGTNFIFSGAGSVSGIWLNGNGVLPALNANASDNTEDLGQPDVRWDDIYATNSSIQTSDEREKQQIASLTDAEITAATAISKLFKTFKWKDKVAEKGDAARTHTGVIAQQVETAMSDAGLDAGDYAFFISATWWETQTEVAAVEADEENGIEARDAYTRTNQYYTQEEAPEGATERNRKGIRYPELLSFIGAATEQRLTSIEARLDALEAE